MKPKIRFMTIAIFLTGVAILGLSYFAYKKAVALGALSPVQTTDTIGTLRTRVNQLIDQVQNTTSSLGNIASLASTTGNLVVGSSTQWTFLGVGADGQVLSASSGAVKGGLAWINQAGVTTSTFSATAPIFYNANTATFSLGISAVSSSRAINTSGYLFGGGDLSADRTLTLGITPVSSTRAITAGSGLVGGGDLSADRTIWFNALQATTTITNATTTNLRFTSATGTSVSFSDGTTFKTAFKDIGFNALNATTTNGAASSSVQKLFYQAITIANISCSTDGASVTIGADERASSTPQTLGTNVFNGGAMTCTNTGVSTSTFANATIAANAILNFGITSVANSTTTLRVHIKYSND